MEQLSNTHAATHSGSGEHTAVLDHNTEDRIAQIVKDISDDIDLLYRLSYSIRQASAERVYREVTAEPSLKTQLNQDFKARMHEFITQKFPQCSEALCERLSLAILIRRNRFRYLQKRYRDLEPERYPDSIQLEPLPSLCLSGTADKRQWYKRVAESINAGEKYSETSPQSLFKGATIESIKMALLHRKESQDLPLAVTAFRSTSSSGCMNSSPPGGISYPAPPQAFNGTEATCPYCLITLLAVEFENKTRWM